MRGLYFVEHGLQPTQAEGLCQALEQSLGSIGLRPYESGHEADKSASVIEACQRTYLSTLGVFDLSVPSPNAYLGIGLSLGLNKPSLIVAGQGMTSAIPKILNRANILSYTPPLKTGKSLQRAALRSLESTSEAQNAKAVDDLEKRYCLFCDRLCRGWRQRTQSKGMFVLDGKSPRWDTLHDTVLAGTKPTGLKPVFLTQLKGQVMPLLCEMRLAVNISEFTLVDASVSCEPEQYIALGMAIGMRRPWMLTTSQPDRLPALFEKTSYLEYSTEEELQQQLGRHILKTFYPARYGAKRGVTTRIELPFWLQLEDWIARFEVGTSRTMEGNLQLLLIEDGQLKQRCRMVPNTTITAGRDSECDLAIESQSVSRFHADFIFNGQELLVMDRESTNGTFVGGSPIEPGEQIPLEVGNRVRMGPAEVVVWNEQELPDEIKEYLPETGRLIPQLILINLSDGLVLANGKVPVARLSAPEVTLVEYMHGKGQDVTATNEIAQIVYGTGQVSRMIVASFIDGLRAKIEPQPSKPRFLVSEAGVGYQLRTRGGQLVIRPR
jgi:pSer/pThr/pTyr-binding forkhead associated (FHA) protein